MITLSTQDGEFGPQPVPDCVPADAFACLEGVPLVLTLSADDQLAGVPSAWPGGDSPTLSFDRTRISWTPKDVGGWIALALPLTSGSRSLRLWCNPAPSKLRAEQVDDMLAEIRRRQLQLYRAHVGLESDAGVSEEYASAEAQAGRVLASLQRLEQATSVILRAPLQRLERTHRLVPFAQVSRPSAQTFLAWAAFEGGAQRVPCAAVATLPDAVVRAKDGRCYLPSRLPDQQSRRSFDVPENRLLKRALMVGIALLGALRARNWKGQADQESMLANGQRRLGQLLRRGFLPEIQPWPDLSVRTLQLRRSPGYRDLLAELDTWRREPLLDRTPALGLAWSEPWRLFEISVALAVHEVVRTALIDIGFDEALGPPVEVDATGGGFLISWIDNQVLGAWERADVGRIEVIYQSVYPRLAMGRDDDEYLYYHGRDRKPDVVVRCRGSENWAVLVDAKYRSGKRLLDAIDEVATYKDSIRGAAGEHVFRTAIAVGPWHLRDVPAPSLKKWAPRDADAGDYVGIARLDPAEPAWASFRETITQVLADYLPPSPSSAAPAPAAQQVE